MFVVMLQAGVRDLLDYAPDNLAITGRVLACGVPGDHLFHSQRSSQPSDQPFRVLTLPLHSQVERPETPDSQPPFQAPQHTTQERPLVAQRPIPLFPLDGQNTTEHVAVTTQILRPGMHDDIRPMRERVLQARRAERRVDKQIRAPRVRLRRVFGDLVRLARRVQRRFQEHHVALL